LQPKANYQRLTPDYDPRLQNALTETGLGRITTEILNAPEFYYAEEYHQQYLAKNPWGYCGLGGTGVRCPTSVIETT
jgi:peptide-methionine (S)-S-oxide reductase